MEPTRARPEACHRLVNKDDSFNVKRSWLSFWDSITGYHTMLRMSWPKFLFFTLGSYLLVNALFALAYLTLG